MNEIEQSAVGKESYSEQEDSSDKWSKTSSLLQQGKRGKEWDE